MKAKTEDRMVSVATNQYAWNCSAHRRVLALSTSSTKIATRWRVVPGTSYKTAPPHKEWKPFSYVKGVAFGGARLVQTGALASCYAGTPNAYSVRYSQKEILNNNYFVSSVASGSAPTSPDAHNIALAKIVSSLQGERQNWMAGVTLGEGRETVRGIVQSGMRLVHGMNALKKGKVREAYRHLAGRYSSPHGYQNAILRRVQKNAQKKNYLDDISSAWMELSFAWLPLLSDVDAAASWAAFRRLQPGPLCRVSRKHKATWTTTQKIPTTPGSSYQVLRTENMEDHVRITAEVKPVYLQNRSTLAEYGLTDPASIAWNLLPLSFVVDWFVNVGQVLESLYEFNQWQVVRGLKAQKRIRRTNERLIKDYDQSSGYAGGHYAPNDQFLRNEWYNRSLFGAFPTAIPLRVNVSNPADLKNGQLATLIVLMRYAFR